MTLSRFLAAGVTALAVAGAGAGFAASHADPAAQRAVMARHAHMTLNAYNLGPLGAMAKGEMEYDAARATAAAQNLAALAKLDETGYWPEGSAMGEVDGSEALPEIWQNMEDFQSKQAALAEATAKLAGVAGDGLDQLKAGLGEVGGACGACHRTYRKPD